MKRRKKEAPQELYSKQSFDALLLQHGFTLKEEEEKDAEDKIFTFFLASLKEELRDVVRVAILDADKKGKRAITMDNVDAIQRAVKTFTK